MLTLQKRITEAAKMLDHEVPGWYNMIDIEQLEMANCMLCTLGQLFGSKNEQKLQTILDQKTYAEIKAETKGVPFSFTKGLTYLRIKGYQYNDKYESAIGSFGSTGKCEWIKEIATRRANDLVNKETNDVTQ